MSPEVLGFIAGALSSTSLVPQLIRVFKLKSAREISLPFTSLFLVGVLLWLAYGIYLGLAPVILWNAVAASLMATLMLAKLKWEKARKVKPS